MLTFYIARHGQAQNNLNQKLSGWLDTPLTDAGIQNAHASAAKLDGVKIDTIIASDLGRAVSTAQIIASDIGYGAELLQTSELREVNYGELGGTPIAEVIEKAIPLNNGDFVPKNGESLNQMQNRVLAFLGKLATEYADASILLVAHDGTINAIYADSVGITVSEADATRRNSHDIVARFIYADKKVQNFEEL